VGWVGLVVGGGGVEAMVVLLVEREEGEEK
jgi:hypothetical protein